MTISKRLEILELRKRKATFIQLPFFLVNEDETPDEVLKRYCDENGLDIDEVQNERDDQIIFFQGVSVD